MAIHTDLQIHKVAYDLYGLIVQLVKNLPKDLKPAIGYPMRDQCRALTVLIQRTNIARKRDKLPHLDAILEGVSLVELDLRTLRDGRTIATKLYAAAILLTTSIGKQASGLRKAFDVPPVA